MNSVEMNSVEMNSAAQNPKATEAKQSKTSGLQHPSFWASSQTAFEPPECPNIQIWVYRIGKHSRGAKMNTSISIVRALGVNP